jgi:hypothetical protein
LAASAILAALVDTRTRSRHRAREKPSSLQPLAAAYRRFAGNASDAITSRHPNIPNALASGIRKDLPPAADNPKRASLIRGFKQQFTCKIATRGTPKGEVTMQTARNIAKAISFAAALLLTALASAPLPARSQEAAAPYSKMAPVDQYLMTDRTAEIAMARSAAPPSISADAEVMVLGRHGYETVVKGKNGFVCLVERSWMSPFDFAQFWNPKMRGPICFNPPAVRSILPLTFKRTELVLAGMSKDQIIAAIKAFDANGLPPLEPGAMSYMMSTRAYLNDSAGHWVPHLMFYVPLTDPKSWGADLPGTPVMLNPQFAGAAEPITEYMIPVSTWSDGTAAPKEAQ